MAGKAANTGKYGEWAFLLGVVLALIIGLFSAQLGEAQAYVMGVLVILGFVVGLLNIKEKEVNSFLIAAIALLALLNVLGPIEATLKLVPEVGTIVAEWLSGFLGAIGAFVAPAALVIALKAIYNLATR
jgi:hypothetical protein